MLIDHDRRYAFLHIPKTAGVAVSDALGKRHRTEHHDLNNLDEADEYFRFCFARQPIQRFISAYRYSVKMLQKGKISGDPVRQDIQRHGLDASVGELVDFYRRGNGADRLLRALHFRPQMHWIQNGRPTFIGRTESLERDLQWLAMLLNLDLGQVEHKNTSADDSVDTYLTTAQEDWLRQLYHDDFAFLGYE